MLLLLLACVPPSTSPEPEDSEASAVRDLTEEYPDPPEGGLALRSPVMEIPPYSEVLLCYFGTYTGPTIGVTFMQPLQSEFSHHNQLKAVYSDTYADGELIDCSLAGEQMSQYAPLFESVGIEASPDTEDGNWLELPQGIAMKLQNGQRWVMDMHYINPTGQTLLVNNGVNLDYIPEDEVKAWAGSIQFDGGVIQIPAESAGTDVSTCAFEQDATLLSVLGHMHSRGTHYAVDYHEQGGQTERIYDVAWDGDHHPYYPEITSYAPGEFEVKEGESFTTTCDYYNFEDHQLQFPEEMCTTVVVLYPLERPRVCIEGKYRD